MRPTALFCFLSLSLGACGGESTSEKRAATPSGSSVTPGSGANSGDSPVPADPAPEAPTDLVAMPTSSGSVSLTWRHPAAANVVEYEVERDGAALGRGATSSWVDDGVSASARACYRVRAFAQGGAGSSPSGEACATTPPEGADPSVLRGLTLKVEGSGSGFVSASGGECDATCTELYPADSVVVLTASEGSGSFFSSWVGCDVAEGSRCEVLLDRDRVVRASFSDGSKPMRSLTTVRTGSGGGTVSGAGISCGSDCAEQHPEGSEQTLVAAPDSDSSFVGWSGCDAVEATSCTVNLSSDRTVEAQFERKGMLMIAKSGDGVGTVTGLQIDCGGDCSGAYESGTEVRLSAMPGTNSVFDGWSGCDALDGDSCLVTVSGARTVNAEFGLLYDLSVSVNDSGLGSVSGTGISCGSDCEETLRAGTTVSLTAQAGTKATFVGWTGCDTESGATCEVTLSSNRSVEARFVPNYTLSVARLGAGASQGAIIASPAGISCAPDCSEDYPAGTVVTLTATAFGDADLFAWGGACAGAPTTCTLTMSADVSVSAIFQRTVTLTPVRDNLVLINSQNAGAENTAYPSAELAVGCNWTYSNVTGIQDFVCAQSYVKFDASLFSGREIISANLELDVNYTGIGSRQWEIRALATGWGSNITWSSSDTLEYYLASPLSLSPPAGTALPYEVDLTGYAQNWANGSWADRGIVLRNTSYGFPNTTQLQAFAFYSDENDGVRLEVSFY